MRYDFDQVIERRGTDSKKWNGMAEMFGVDDAVPMWIADMDFAAPPTVVDAIKQRAEHPVYGYAVRLDAYDQAIVGWLARRQGWQVRQEWLATSPGVIAGLALAVAAFTQPGDRIIIQPPVYPRFALVASSQHREVVHNPLLRQGDTYVMDYDDLERQARAGARMLILCSPHNPVGRVWERAELERLGRICLEHDILVVSDEIHGDLIYAGHRQTPFGSLSEDFARNSVTLLAPTKTFNLAGLHTSVVIIPDEAARRSWDASPFARFASPIFTFGAAALTAAYSTGDEWLDQLMAYLQGNLDYVTRYIREQIPSIRVVPPQGTFLVWLDCRGLGLDDEALNRFMRQEAKVAMNGGSMFGPGGSGFQRLNIGCPRAQVAAALDRIRDAVARLGAGGTAVAGGTG